jgi:hypothetical protein
MIVKSYKSRSEQSHMMFILSLRILQAYKERSIWNNIPVLENQEEIKPSQPNWLTLTINWTFKSS